ncbi:MAG: hypothetical protein ACRDPZ_14235 [Gaiellaceae bacterium]
MRGSLAWIVAILAGIAVVLIVTAMIGTRDDRGETVTAGEWAQSTCGAVGVWRGQIEAIVEDIRTPNASSTAGSEEPQSETPQGRAGFFRKGLERAIAATESLVEGIDNVGTPDTPEGNEAARLVSDWADETLNELEDAEDSLDEEADSLEESIVQLAEAAGAIASALTSGAQTVADVARLDPELAAALEDSSTCQQLREETG